LLGAGTDARPVRTENGNYRRFYELAVAWLRDGGPPPVNPEDGIAALEMIEAARTASAQGRVINVRGPG
jgi:predicted dehydrogenase